jgi:3D (Asp-Asp-Asp) domain-containing protein
MHAKTPARGAIAGFVGAILCSTGSTALAQEPLKLPGSQLEPIKWTELAGWSADDHLAAFAAYLASCQALRKNPQFGDDRPIEPIGAQGVPLTPGRSIAVDRLHEYGTPFFIEAKLPTESADHASVFHRLMVAQDTGSAIVGPARADLYLGAGDDAGHIARRIRHPGRFVMLLPRELDMIAAGKQMPLPLPKPKFAEVEVRKHNGKGEADWAKSKVDPRAAAAYARGATGAHIDPKPPASLLAPRSVAVSKQVKQVDYQSTGITVPSYGRNSQQAGNSTAHNKQVRLNSPSRGRTSIPNWFR